MMYKFLLSIIIILISSYVHAWTWYAPIGANPQFVMIGDSTTAGYYVQGGGPAPPGGCSEGSDCAATSYPTQFAALAPTATYLNKGTDSQTSTQIAARWTADVINNNPRYVVVCMGLNDFPHTSPYNPPTDPTTAAEKATWLANYATVLTASVAAGIVPVVVGIPPRDSGSYSLAEEVERADWNTSLQATLTASYPTAVYVDLDATLGTLYAGGPVGNKLRMNTAYGAGVHFNSDGYGLWAAAVKATLVAAGKFQTDGSITIGGSQTIIIGGSQTLTINP